MPTEKKRRLVQELKERLSRCTIAVATDYVGLTANEMTQLRKHLRDRGVEYRVVKNTLTWIAADEAARAQVKSIVQGPTALALGYGDPAEVPKALAEYIRATRSNLVIRGAELDGRALSAAQVASLVTLPSREVLLGQLTGQLQAPVASLVGVLSSPIGGLLGILSAPLSSLSALLQARVRQLEASGGQ